MNRNARSPLPAGFPSEGALHVRDQSADLLCQLDRIPSNAQIQKYIRRIVFGKNVFCPVCRSRKVVRYEARYRCKSCREKFSLLSHTWLSNMKLSYTQFWMLLCAWTHATPIRETAARTHLSEKTVRRWFGEFSAHLPKERHILERILQLDQAFAKKNDAQMGEWRVRC